MFMKKWFAYNNKKKQNNQRGFTLIELILYAGILSILVGVMSTIFASILDVQLESEATAGVDQDGRFILGRMIYDIKSLNENDEIVIPGSAGGSSPTVQFKINNIDYSYSADVNGNLFLTNIDTGEAIRLNGYDTVVTGLNFQRIGDGTINDTLRVSFTVQSRVQQQTTTESRAFQTTIARQ